MAILRSELHGLCNARDTRSTYDAIVENVEDLNVEETFGWSVGSMAFVWSTGEIFVKHADESWLKIPTE